MSYKTIRKEGIAELLVEKSKFIAYAKPVADKEEAMAYFASIRKKYKDATHHVPAVVAGEVSQVQWTSDDGEPQGTAGPPILQMLVKEEITNVALMVVRYFGGVKLGPGGLIRAYTQAAKSALLEAEPILIRDMVEWTILVDYPYCQKLEQMAANGEFELLGVAYSDVVTMTILFTESQIAGLRGSLKDLTSGSIKILSEVYKNT